MFPKKQRVPREIIEKIMSEGLKSSSELFLIKSGNNSLEINRFAVVISKKVSKGAVKRHFLKRKMNNAIRENIDLFNTGQDYVFILFPNSSEKDIMDFSNEIKKHKDFLLNK